MPRKRKVAVPNQENVKPIEKIVEKPKKVEQGEKPAKKQKREPDFLVGDGQNVVKIILSVQKSDCNSSKCLNQLKKLYEKMSHSNFMKAFLATLQTFLVRDDGDEYASRGLKFMSVFVADYGEVVTESGASHPIIDTFFSHILEITSNEVHVRTRICLLVTNTMSSFSQKAELDETIIEKITERMLYFMKDKSPLVRTQAALALQRLQDPENPNEDPVTRAFVYHMESDPAPKVRQSTITAIAKKIHNIPAILDRLYDVDEKVRRHTYLQMSSYSVKSYKIADRITILSAGLNDRSDLVKKAIVNLLLPNWIGVYDYDYADFVRAIKLDSNENELVKFRSLAETALKEIFKKRKINDLISYFNGYKSKEFENCLQLDKSSLEMLIVWKMIIKSHQDYVNGKRKDNHEIREDGESDDEEESTMVNQTLSNIDIMPELSRLCDYIEKIVNDFKFGTELGEKYQKIYFSQCVVVLLEIVQLNDLGDEIGKERLQKLLKNILLTYDLSEFAIQEIAHVIEKIIPEIESRLTFFVRIVTEIIKPGVPSEYSRQTIIDDLIDRSDISIRVQAKEIKLRMMDLKEQETHFVQQKQYAECQKVSEEYNKLSEKLVELLKPVAELQASESSISILENLSTVVTSKKITSEEILKSLRICFYAVMMKGVKTITHDIHQIYNEFVRYHLESNDLTTRIWALKTATAYSLLYESIAKEIYLIIKSQVFKSTHLTLWECSIQCIFDLLLLYGVEKMEGDNIDTNSMSMSMNSQNRTKRGGRTLYTNVEDEEDEQDEMNIIKTLDIMQMLLHLLEHSVDLGITKVLICGFCKMIIHGIYCTREIMSKFLLMYFNPATTAEISQMLGIFLENVIKRKKQEYLHDALIPTITTLVEAPYDSPLREVKLETVLKYIVGATRPVFCSNGLNLHNTLAMEFLDVMKENPDSKEILKIFAKELSELEIGEDPILKGEITKHIEIILKESSADARTKKYLTDFCKILSGTYRAPLNFSSTAKVPNNEEDDEIEEEQLENIEEENEEEEDKEELKSQENEKSLSKAQEIDFEFVSPSKIKIKEFDLKVSKIHDSVINKNDESSLSESKNDESQHRTIVDESLNESEIPASPLHINLPATQIVHLELPATQEISEIDLTEVNSDEDASILSSDVPSTPATPLTVVKKAGGKKKQVETPISSIEKSVSHYEYPATPEARSRNLLGNVKRHLDITRSNPVTPSQSSPLRKNAKTIVSTPKSAVSTRKSVSVTPKSAPSTSQKNNSPITTRVITSSTPNTESRTMTRNQSKIEVAQNVTLTRSASKALNVKPTAVAKAAKTKEPEKRNVSATNNDKPAKKPEVKASKLPVRTTSNVGRPARATRSQNPVRPPWK